MGSVPKLIASCCAGVALGVSVLFLGLVAASSFAFTSDGEVYLPGVFRAWFTQENGLPAMNFAPNFSGMAIVVIAIALAYVGGSLGISARLRRPAEDDGA